MANRLPSPYRECFKVQPLCMARIAEEPTHDTPIPEDSPARRATPGLVGGPFDGRAPPKRPNVVLIITDDQGYGDLGFHGNPQDPDAEPRPAGPRGVRLGPFYVSPVCSPTRASLMTGRYNYRTGVVDTFLGRSMMHPDEVTLAEMLGPAGYRTGIFGKWHLGDNCPVAADRPGVSGGPGASGGGIGQPSDPPGGSSYFDPILQHNGREEKTQGLLLATSTPTPPSTSSRPTATGRSSSTSPSTARTRRWRCPTTICSLTSA